MVHRLLGMISLIIILGMYFPDELGPLLGWLARAIAQPHMAVGVALLALCWGFIYSAGWNSAVNKAADDAIAGIEAKRRAELR